MSDRNWEQEAKDLLAYASDGLEDYASFVRELLEHAEELEHKLDKEQDR